MALRVSGIRLTRPNKRILQKFKEEIGKIVVRDIKPQTIFGCEVARHLRCYPLVSMSIERPGFLNETFSFSKKALAPISFAIAIYGV